MKWFARVFASAVARRLAFVLVALALVWCLPGKAHAQSATSCAASNYSDHCSEAAAYQSCQAGLQLAIAAAASQGGYNPRCTRTMATGTQGNYECAINTYQSFNCQQVVSTARNRYYFDNNICTSGVNPATGQCNLTCPDGFGPDPANPSECMTSQKCLAKPPLGLGRITDDNNPKACSGGCEFSTGQSMCLGSGASKKCFATAGKPTGAACAANAPALTPSENQNQDCQAVEGQTLCVKSNGDHCYPASTGRQICWAPRETGEKNDANYRQKRDAGNTPVPPNLNLPSGDTLSQIGNPTTTTTKTTNPDGTTTTTTTTTTNYVTTNGTNANGGGDNGDQGQNGDGTGGDDGDGDGPGAPGEGGEEGDFYSAGDKTLESVFAAYKARIEAAPIMQAATSFVTVSISGPCPVWTVPATAFFDTLVFNYHCSGELATALAAAGWVFVAIAAWAAFKIGFL